MPQYTINHCCNPGVVIVDPPPPPCPFCLGFDSPVIAMLDSVGPCAETGNVIIVSTANCSAYTLEIISHDDAFTNVNVVGNQVNFTTVLGKAIPGQSYLIRGRGKCTAGVTAGYSAQWVAQITILDRCFDKVCGGCDPCTGLCPPPEILIYNINEIVALP